MNALVTAIVAVSRDVVVVNCWLLAAGIRVRTEESKRTTTKHCLRRAF